MDVRAGLEIAASGTFRGARTLAYGFEGRAASALDPARPVVLYCASGARSGRAARALHEAGFAEVYNAGGFGALETAGLPTE